MARKPQLGPSSDPELLILTSLTNGPKHGYAMMQDIEQFSDARLGPGTLYTAITRLVEKGWIRPEPAEDRQRPYRITQSGITALSEQVEKLQKVIQTGRRRLKFA